MSQADWIISAAGTIDAGLPLRTIVVRDDVGTLAALAPLLVAGRGPVAHLTQIGNRTYEPPSFVFGDEQALGALFDAIDALNLPFMLRGLYADSTEAKNYATRTSGIRPMARGIQATAIKRLASETLDATIAGQRRSIVRRKRKAAEKLGSLDIAFFSPDIASVDEALQQLVEVEAAGWKGRAGTSLSQDIPMQEFYRRYARLAARAGTLRFGRITIGGQLAAMRMDVEWAGERWELKIGFDERFADVSPGQLLSYETFKDAIARGSQVHNFLGGYEPWQDDWGIEVRPLTNLRYYPSSPRGLAALGVDTAGFALRKLASKWKRN
jgi:CelD/BcsL family acetyltransferase involved in cellulose biosynthesis